MEERKKDSRRAVTRRNFLALAGVGAATAAAAVTGWPEGNGLGKLLPSMMDGERAAEALDTGGIAIEHFEAARKRAAAMVKKLTLAEKITQFDTKVPAVKRLDMPGFNFYGSEGLHGLLHPGPITSFPLPLALGCSWNRDLIQRVFSTVSDEIWAWHKKGDQSLAMFSPPTVNMGTRDPRWGRIGENYSEDPYLVGQLATYTIHGMQGHDERYLKTIACAKHFIANDTDDDRYSVSASVDPRSFWEYYTRGFETCVREGRVFTVMSSYNALNGIPTTASRFLLTDVLRDRWGFRGYVVSDCDAVADICRSHHFVPTFAEAAALAVNAGCDINCGDTLRKYLGEAVDKMLISEEALDRSLIRSLTGRILLGDFDPPDQNPYSKIPISCLESPAHKQVALEAARESVVLFKNQANTLPLDKNRLKKIAVIGPMADVCYLGNYSGAPLSLISPLQGIKERLGLPLGPAYHKRASDYAKVEGGAKLESYCSEGGRDLTDIKNGSGAAYDKVLFTGATRFHARVASLTAGGTIEVHLDAPGGPLVATLKVSNTGGWQKWEDVSAPLKPVKGEHSIYLHFTGGQGKLLNLQSFNLTPTSPFAGHVKGSVKVGYAIGCNVLGEKDAEQFDEAVKIAKEADVALVFVGANEQVDAEAQDRNYIHLPGAQHELVKAVYAANPNTILVISSNCPVAVNWEQEHLPAIMGGLFLGQQQGYALADVLFGNYNPGGKISTTWYHSVDELPDFHDYNIRQGRTYMYFRGIPLYPFGHGLSYTTFKYKNLQVSDRALKPGGKVAVSFDLTNSGKREGDEIVQLYVRFITRTLDRPALQLVNFDRVHLKAGETKSVSLDLDYESNALRYWDEDKYEFVVEPARVEVMVGASSADIKLRGELELRS